MKAFIHGIDENGKDYLGTSFPTGGIVTKEYKNLSSLVRYNLKYNSFIGKSFHIEAFYSWNNRYSKADIDLKIKITENKGYVILNNSN